MIYLLSIYFIPTNKECCDIAWRVCFKQCLLQIILWENVFCSVKAPLLVLVVIVQEVSSLAKSFKSFFRVVCVCSYTF